MRGHLMVKYTAQEWAIIIGFIIIMVLTTLFDKV